jgi:hypothetical protein
MGGGAMLIGDIGGFILGGWLFSWLTGYRERRLATELKDKIYNLKCKEDELARREAELSLLRDTAQAMLDKMKSATVKLKQSSENMGDDLDRLTAQDAIRRENRAKAALKAIMEQDGCTREAIEKVMSSVDGDEDGDLKT